MVRLTREQAQARTRSELLESAAVVFARRGFHAASVEEVGAEAGYSKGAVYSNFASKDALFLAVLRTRMQAQAALFTELEERARTAIEELPALVPGLDWVDETWCLLLFEFWLYAFRNPPVLHELGVFYGQFRAQLAPLVARYAGTQMHPEELAAVLIAAYQGLALQAHADPTALRPDIVGRLVKALHEGAAAHGPTRTPVLAEEEGSL